MKEKSKVDVIFHQLEVENKSYQQGMNHNGKNVQLTTPSNTCD